MNIALEQSIPFTVYTHAPSTGELMNADSTPTYQVYENGSSMGGEAGNLTNSTTGVYTLSVSALAANGYENGKSYEVRVTAVVEGRTEHQSLWFQVAATPPTAAQIWAADLSAAAADNSAADYLKTAETAIQSVKTTTDANLDAKVSEAKAAAEAAEEAAENALAASDANLTPDVVAPARTFFVGTEGNKADNIITLSTWTGDPITLSANFGGGKDSNGLNPGTTIQSVDSVTVTNNSDDSTVTVTNLAKQQNRVAVNYDVAAIDEAGQFTVRIEATSTDGQPLVLVGQLVVE